MHRASRCQYLFKSAPQFAFFSGLRMSELINHMWADVEATLVVVRSAKVEGESKSTKTSQVRFVELNTRAKTAIKRQKAHTHLKSQYVFVNPITGEAWHDQRCQSKSTCPYPKEARVTPQQPLPNASNVCHLNANGWRQPNVGCTSALPCQYENHARGLQQVD